MNEQASDPKNAPGSRKVANAATAFALAVMLASCAPHNKYHVLSRDERTNVAAARDALLQREKALRAMHESEMRGCETPANGVELLSYDAQLTGETQILLGQFDAATGSNDKDLIAAVGLLNANNKPVNDKLFTYPPGCIRGARIAIIQQNAKMNKLIDTAAGRIDTYLAKTAKKSNSEKKTEVAKEK